MWRSPSLGSLLTAEPVTVWTDTDPSRDRNIWAPEFHRFGNRWYLYYTADDGVDEHTGCTSWSRRARTRPARTASGPGSPRPTTPTTTPSSPACSSTTDASTSLRRHQPVPAQRAQHRADVEPLHRLGRRVALDADGGCPEVREGPEFLNRNGRTWMTYSTCDTGRPDYQIWMMSLSDGADPLRPGNWIQHDGPVFFRADDRGVFGPGHHSFFRSPDGTEDWIVYHAKTTATYAYTDRTTRAQGISWNADGSPALGRPLALGATQDLPSGDPGAGTYWINDDGRASGDGTVTYTGGWNSGTGCAAQCFWGDDHWSDRAGNTATFTFTGTRIALLSVRDTGNGIAALSIDGGPEQRVDFHGAIRVGETLQYLSPRLPYGRHTLRVRVTGEHNAQSRASFVSVDRAEVYTR